MLRADGDDAPDGDAATARNQGGWGVSALVDERWHAYCVGAVVNAVGAPKLGRGVKNWEAKVLSVEGAAKRIAEIEDELRLAAGLTALRERAGVSQRELAEQMGVSQPRIVAIEKSRNVTIDVLDAYVSALGGRLEVSVVRAGRRTKLLGESASAPCWRQRCLVMAWQRLVLMVRQGWVWMG